MVTIKILKKYDDVVLNRRVLPGEVLQVDIERATKLLGMGLAEVLKIDRIK